MILVMVLHFPLVTLHVVVAFLHLSKVIPLANVIMCSVNSRLAVILHDTTVPSDDILKLYITILKAVRTEYAIILGSTSNSDSIIV